MAEKRGEKSTANPSKAFFFLGGPTEGFETVLRFVAMCLWPKHFPLIASLRGALRRHHCHPHDGRLAVFLLSPLTVP